MNLKNSLGLSFVFSQAGAVSRIAVDPICISGMEHSACAEPAANLYLRRRGDARAYTPLFGPLSPSRFSATEGAFEARGQWTGLDYVCRVTLSPSALAWRFQVHLESRLASSIELDLIYVQAVHLKTHSAGLLNAYYVSQYLERRLFDDARHGCVLCCRQNMREASGHPWLMLACEGGATSASTDGLQLYGRTFRATGEPEALHADSLPGELSGESSVVALAHAPFVLEAGQAYTSGFVASYVPDHPAASSQADLSRLPEILGAFDDPPASVLERGAAHEHTSLCKAPLLRAQDLTQAELTDLFGSAWRHVERDDGQLLSFFTEGPRHVVLRAKELAVDRPHGHILQAFAGERPDERVVSTTAFACGIFNSHLAQGNTDFNTLLSVCTEPARPSLSGQRVLIQQDDREFLLGVPSAFEMGLAHCRWIYKHEGGCLEVCSWTSPDAPYVHLAVQVLRGGPVRLRLTHAFDDLNGWRVEKGAAGEFIARPRPTSMLSGRYPNAQFRLVVHGDSAQVSTHHVEAEARDAGRSEHARLVLTVPTASAFCMSFVGEVTGAAPAPRLEDAQASRKAAFEVESARWQSLSRALSLRGPAEISAIDATLPWFGMNALVHYLTPYGLEQFSGAAWGTRDVCQGPLDLLLSQERYAEAKELLRVVFSHQDPDGGWPQWWMFDRYASIRADGAHGDVVYWCILALSSYVKSSGDFAFLQQRLPYYVENAADAPTATVAEHVDQIIERVVASFVPGTALVPFGGGDWNDSLQPVNDDLARRLISSWTVQMSYQALDEYREVCARAGMLRRARELEALAGRIHADFQRQLVRDGVVAGYGLVHDDQTVEALLHPRDTQTGVHYSLLPMNRGVISGMFTRAQAEHHLALVERHLKGPDGARLMDRPLRYRGGPQTLFQRAESSTYFGREIGLMYVHEHLRYAEALARMGRPEALLRALRQATPVDYREVVPQGDLRQANCYYSSSDVLFATRYEADARYADVIDGKLPLKGGWRVYSSGPGIFISLVVTRLLGIRAAYAELIFDPVLAPSLDGLVAKLRFCGRAVSFVFRVEGPGFGPRSIVINGAPVSFEREPNPYRVGGATIERERFMKLLTAEENIVELVV